VRYNTERERYGIGSAGQVLQVSSSLPTWSTINLADSVLTVQGDVLYEGASALARLGQSTDNFTLATKGAGANPAWQASATSVLTTTGDLLYASGANTLARLAGGTSGDVLTAQGAGVAPSYQTPSGGGGKLTLISRSEVSSGTEIDISFTSESGANISSLVCYYDIQRTNVGTCNVLLQYGSSGLVTSGYYSTYVRVSNSANVAYSNQAEWLLATNPNYRRFCGMVQIYLADPSMTTSQADLTFTGNSVDTNPEGYLAIGSHDTSVYAIDEVKLSLSASALEAGSVMTLYSVDST